MSRDINTLSVDSAARVQDSARTSGASSRDTIGTMTDEFLWTQALVTESTMEVQGAQAIGQFQSQNLRIS